MLSINSIVEGPNFYADFVIAVVLVCILLFGYIIVKIATQKAEELLAKTYLENKMV